MSQLTYTLTREDVEIELTLEYEVAHYYPAQISGPPESCSPAEGGEVTSLTATDAEGNEVSLTEEETERVHEFIYANHEYDGGWSDGDDSHEWDA